MQPGGGSSTHCPRLAAFSAYQDGSRPGSSSCLLYTTRFSQRLPTCQPGLAPAQGVQRAPALVRGPGS
eukprot:365631-Chlamydomonas_euryale.AAC.6